MIWRPGDIGAERNSSLSARLIQVGQRMSGDRNWRWNHIFMATDEHGSTIEAEGNGVVRGFVGDRDVINLGCPSGVDRLAVVGFAKSKLGLPYDWLNLACMTANCIFGLRLHTHNDHSFICSELGAAALVAGGWHAPKVPALMKPGDLVDALGTVPATF